MVSCGGADGVTGSGGDILADGSDYSVTVTGDGLRTIIDIKPVASRGGLATVRVLDPESPDTSQTPPEDAGVVLDVALVDQRGDIAGTLAAVDHVTRSPGCGPVCYRLVCWVSQVHGDRDHGPGSEDWRMANADSRAVAAVLAARGTPVRWVDRGWTPDGRSLKTPVLPGHARRLQAFVLSSQPRPPAGGSA